MNQFFIERYIANDAMLRNLSEEQIAKARECKSGKELLELAKQEGIELNEEQLNAVSGGACDGTRNEAGIQRGFKCPNCGSTNTIGEYNDYMFNSKGGYHCICSNCSAHFDAQ